MRVATLMCAGVVALANLAAGGCAKQSPPEEAHTVSWYVEHKDERELQRKVCAEDAARQATANCINAEEAWHKVQLQPNVKSFADDLKFK